MYPNIQCDTAQICKNGHLITSHADYVPAERRKFCPKCNAPVISACPHCHARIKGAYYELRTFSQQTHLFKDSTSYTTTHTELKNIPYEVPAYCDECGYPFPWTERLLESANAIFDMLDDVSPENKEKLKEIFPDLISDTSKTIPSALLFEKIISPLAPIAKTAMQSAFGKAIAAKALEFIHF